MTNKKEYMIILFLHLPPLVLTQSRVRTSHAKAAAFLFFRKIILPKMLLSSHNMSPGPSHAPVHVLLPL